MVMIWSQDLSEYYYLFMNYFCRHHECSLMCGSETDLLQWMCKCNPPKFWLLDCFLQWGRASLTPAGDPQTAAWASSLSQGAAGHQASWQPLSCSRSVSLLLLLLHGMAVVPLTEEWTALQTDVWKNQCRRLSQSVSRTQSQSQTI